MLKITTGILVCTLNCQDCALWLLTSRLDINTPLNRRLWKFYDLHQLQARNRICREPSFICYVFYSTQHYCSIYECIPTLLPPDVTTTAGLIMSLVVQQPCHGEELLSGGWYWTAQSCTAIFLITRLCLYRRGRFSQIFQQQHIRLSVNI